MQIKWVKQIASALLHLRYACRTFYSDLRPDNVLLNCTESGVLEEDIVLIDFEQRGNWYEWCAPEIRYRMYVEHIRNHTAITNRQTAASDAARTLVRVFDQIGSTSGSLNKDSIIQGLNPSLTSRNIPWYSLTEADQLRLSQIYRQRQRSQLNGSAMPGADDQDAMDVDVSHHCTLARNHSNSLYLFKPLFVIGSASATKSKKPQSERRSARPSTKAGPSAANRSRGGATSASSRTRVKTAYVEDADDDSVSFMTRPYLLFSSVLTTASRGLKYIRERPLEHR